MTSAKITLLSMLAAQSDKKTPTHHPLLMKVIIARFHFRLSAFRHAAEPSARLNSSGCRRMAAAAGRCRGNASARNVGTLAPVGPISIMGIRV